MSIRYEDLTSALLSRLPEVKHEYTTDQAYYEGLRDLQHVMFGDLLNPLLLRKLRLGDDVSFLASAFDFLECLAMSEDLRVQEVVQMTVLERIGDDKAILLEARRYMGPRSRKLSEEIERFWGRE